MAVGWDYELIVSEALKIGGFWWVILRALLPLRLLDLLEAAVVLLLIFLAFLVALEDYLHDVWVEILDDLLAEMVATKRLFSEEFYAGLHFFNDRTRLFLYLRGDFVALAERNAKVLTGVVKRALGMLIWVFRLYQFFGEILDS